MNIEYSIKKPKTIIRVFSIAWMLSFLLACNAWAEDLQLKIDGDTISIHAVNIPLQEILRSLEHSGISVRAKESLNPTINASFKNEDLQKGLARIFQSLDYVLIWKNDDSGGGEPGRQSTLGEIVVFGESKRVEVAPYWDEPMDVAKVDVSSEETAVVIKDNRVYVPVILQ